jgi:hypothetical protein
MARRESFEDYRYTVHKHEDGVQHAGIRRTTEVLKTVEVIVFHDGPVRIQESAYHVPSEWITFTPAIELIGEEGAEEAQYRINEMRHRKAH